MPRHPTVSGWLTDRVAEQTGAWWDFEFGVFVLWTDWCLVGFWIWCIFALNIFVMGEILDVCICILNIVWWGFGFGGCVFEQFGIFQIWYIIMLGRFKEGLKKSGNFSWHLLLRGEGVSSAIKLSSATKTGVLSPFSVCFENGKWKTVPLKGGGRSDA